MKNLKNYQIESFTIVMLGGSIGGSTIRSLRELKGKDIIDPDYEFSDRQTASDKAKRLNKILSPGEKKYYGIKYKVASLINKKFTGK